MTNSDISQNLSSEFPRSMGRPAINALGNSEITTFMQATALSEKDLMEMHGVGPKAVSILKQELADRGLSLKNT